MTAVGARYLARPDSRVLGHVGARGTAFWNVVLLDELFDLDEIRVTSRRPESREAFARAARRGDPAPGPGDRHRGGGLRRRGHPGRGVAADRTRAAAAHRRGQARRLRRALRHGQRGGTRPARRDGQGGGRRLAGGAVGPVRRAAPPRGHRPALGRVAARRAGPDRHRPAARAGSATTRGSCSGTAGWPSSTSPSAWPSCAGPSSRTPARCSGTADDARAGDQPGRGRGSRPDQGRRRAASPSPSAPGLLAAVRQRCEQARQALATGSRCTASTPAWGRCPRSG